MSISERIRRLRDAAVSPIVSAKEFNLHFYRAYGDNPMPENEERYGKAFLHAMSKITPVIGDDELIVGRAVSHLAPADNAEWEGKYRDIATARMRAAGGGQDSHMAVDYELLLAEGIDGILEKIARLAERADAGQLEFYENCRCCLEAVKLLAGRYAELAAKMAAECKNPARAAELRRIGEVCAHVPAKPARDFWEAVQSVHFVTHCLTFNPFRALAAQQFQLGHPDRYLLPYYERDIAAGKLTRDEAQELLDCLAIQINNRVPSGLSSGYMLGGRDADGSIVANDLTMMGLQAIDDLHLVYPSVGFCWTEGMPEEFLVKCCEILSHGCSHPAIFNDDVITAGLRDYGVPEREAHSYIHSTCVEITPVASSNVWVASPYTNLPQILLHCMDREYDSFEALETAVLGCLGASIGARFEEQNALRLHRSQHSMNPLLSCFVSDCLARGLDIECGGARYNWIMPSFVGMGNLVDSLYAIKTLVYDRRELTIAEYKAACDCNFDGMEPLRSRIAGIPKYGNDVDEVDEMFNAITQFIVAECRKYTPMFSNAKLVPSVFCWIMHEQFGSQTGATPDGRLAGFPLGDGSGPCQGRELCGPTASILSSTKWSHKEFIGGVAVNMKFGKKLFDETARERLLGLIKAYLERGGFELQINVVDHETLLRARENPDEYRDLVVRIGGYSDYFVRLSPNMQDEVIHRTEHVL